ncbi:MAG TPA: PadR family transcriptional regulator [Chloroflexota bacterium]|nr:PadR family transcriptional regulator [Chloroflexota bacterium]
MHKSLHLLGLLLSGPKTGYDLHRIVRAHGDLYADLKKANVYYLLDRLARDGYLEVRAEPGARGPRGERLIYSLTERGRARFEELLREVLRSFEPVPSSIGSAVVFLPYLAEGEAVQLLEERRASVARQREQVAAIVAGQDGNSLLGLAVDHLLALIDADLTWTERTLARLRAEAATRDGNAIRVR